MLADDTTARVRAFYEETPFPNYDDLETAADLVAKAQRGTLASMLAGTFHSRSASSTSGAGPASSLCISHSPAARWWAPISPAPPWVSVRTFGGGHKIGHVNGLIILAIFYVLVLTPYGWTMRMMRADVINSRPDATRDSYWEPRTSGRRRDSYRRPF